MSDVFRVNNKNEFIDTGDKDQPVMHLYSVIVITPHLGTHTLFVLARGPKEAAGQAECALKCASYDISPDIYKLIRSEATRVPFCIQGWGVNKF